MMNSFKPFLYYGIPLLLVFAWLSQTIAYHPIQPGDSFNVTAFTDEDAPTLTLETPDGVTAEKDPLYDPEEGTFATRWTVNADEAGQHQLSVVPNGTDRSFTHTVTVTDGYGYGQVEKSFDNSKVNRVSIGYRAVHPFGSFSVLGYQPGWLFTYIVLSIGFNLVLRKALDVA